MYKTLGTISLAALILAGATGCQPAEPTPQESQQRVIDQAPAAKPGTQKVFDTKITPTDELRFNAKNSLIVSEKEKIAIMGHGMLKTAVLEENGPETKPADGEVFHASTFDSTLPAEAKVSLSVNGKATPLTKPLGKEGTILISAPEDAKIELSVTHAGITQNIDLKTANRTSTGVADVWYKATKAILGEPKVSETFVILDKNVKLDYTVSSATRSPISTLHGLADEGKSSWVIIDGTKPVWAVPDGGTEKVTQKFALTDEAGKEYPMTEHKDAFTGETMHLEFKVPANIDAFLLKLDAGTDILIGGENRGTAAITSEKVQVTFTEVVPTPTPTATGTAPATGKSGVEESAKPTAPSSSSPTSSSTASDK